MVQLGSTGDSCGLHGLVAQAFKDDLLRGVKAWWIVRLFRVSLAEQGFDGFQAFQDFSQDWNHGSAGGPNLCSIQWLTIPAMTSRLRSVGKLNALDPGGDVHQLRVGDHQRLGLRLFD